jgi:putative ABC transport system substrate-binding protein
MKRREFIRLLSGAVVTWPSTALAQKSAMPVVGILHSQTQETEAARMEVFQQGLREGGFVAGQNVTIENRFADGHNDRLPMLATDLAQRQVNVIFGNTTAAGARSQGRNHCHSYRLRNRRRPRRDRARC